MRGHKWVIWGYVLEAWIAAVILFELLQRHTGWAIGLTILGCVVDSRRRKWARPALSGRKESDEP